MKMQSQTQMQKLTAGENKLEEISAEAVLNNGYRISELMNKYSISELVDRYKDARKTVIEWCNKNEAPKSPERERQKEQMRYYLMGGKFNYLRAKKHIFKEQRKETAKDIRANKSYARFLLKHACGETRKYIEKYLKEKKFFSLPKSVEFSAKKDIYTEELEKDGWKLYYISENGSNYYRKNGKTLRISDHIIERRTEDSNYNSKPVNNWNYQIII